MPQTPSTDGRSSPPVPADLTDRHVVVTGGAGFVGSWLCKELVLRGARVTCLDDLSTGSADNISSLGSHDRFEMLRSDLSAPLTDLVDGPVDWVLHLASPASPVHYQRLPVETLRVGSLGTLHALDLAERHDARFLLASTSEVYGDPQVHPQPETYWGNVNPVGPRSVYDEAKRFAEAATAAYRRDRGVNTGIARIFNTYGPQMSPDDGRAVPAFATQALRGEPVTVTGDGSQTRSLCFVSDTVAGLLALTAGDHPGPVNIGNDREVTMLDLARTIRDLAGSTSRIVFLDLPEDDPKVRCPDISLARTALGWQPEVSLEDGLATTLAWFRDHVTAPTPA